MTVPIRKGKSLFPSRGGEQRFISPTGAGTNVTNNGSTTVVDPHKKDTATEQGVLKVDEKKVISDLTDIQSLALTLYGEDRENLDDEAIKKIAHVVFNRVQSPNYPKTIKEVVLQDQQFSCWNSSDPNRPKMIQAFLSNSKDYQRMLTLAISAFEARRQGANPLPNVYNFLANNSLETDTNNRVIAFKPTPVTRDPKHWSVGMLVVDRTTHSFLKRA